MTYVYMIYMIIYIYICIFAATQLVGGLVHPKRAKLTLLALLVTASKTHVLVGVSHQVEPICSIFWMHLEAVQISSIPHHICSYRKFVAVFSPEIHQYFLTSGKGLEYPGIHMSVKSSPLVFKHGNGNPHLQLILINMQIYRGI